MAVAQKYIAASAGATHVAADATITDILNPFGPPLDPTGNVLRSGFAAAVAVVVQSKRLAGAWLA